MKYLHIKFQNKIYFILFCLIFSLAPRFSFSQNYVGINNEMAIRGAIDFSTSTLWKTNRSSTPGYFSWIAGSEDYLGASDSFHVDGYVKKTGGTAFTFPVGDGSDLRTLSISAPSSVTEEYAVAWFSGDPNFTADPTNSNALHSTSSISGSLTAVSTVGQWDWVPIVGNGAGLKITVSLPALLGVFFTDASKVRLVGWNGNSWVVLGDSGATGLGENSLLSGTMIAGIQSIGVGSIAPAVVTPAVIAPVFSVVQNSSNGFLSVSGTAEKNSTVLITFPDGSKISVPVSSSGTFGPVSSNLPQDNKGFVTAIATVASGLTSSLVTVNYDYPITVLVKEAFTPNGDGINDTWVIYELDKYPNSSVRVYNRLGNLVYSSNNYQNDWDGHFNNSSSVLPDSGAYYYQIDFGTDGSIDKQGWLYIRK